MVERFWGDDCTSDSSYSELALRGGRRVPRPHAQSIEEEAMINLHYCATPNRHKVTIFLEEAWLPYRIIPELRLQCCLVLEQLLHAWPLLDPFEMRHSVREFRSLGAELRTASQAPEEMRIRRCKVIEEEFVPSEHVVGDLVVLEQKGLRRLDDALLRTASVTDFRRRVEA